MATSSAQICNLAVGRVGGRGEIQDLATDQSDEAGACRDVYEPMLDEVLCAHDWPFATKWAVLSQLFKVADLTAFTRLDWTYGYALPAGVLKPRALWPGVRNPAPVDSVPYALENYSSATVTEQLVLFTDLNTSTSEPCVLLYTCRVTDTNLFPALFTKALYLRIAEEIAGPLKKEDARAVAARGVVAQQAMQEAIAQSLNQEQRDLTPRSLYLRVRE